MSHATDLRVEEFVIPNLTKEEIETVRTVSMDLLQLSLTLLMNDSIAL